MHLYCLVWLLNYELAIYHSKVVHKRLKIIVECIQNQISWLIGLHLLSGTSTINFFFELMLNAEIYSFFSYTEISTEYGSLSSSLSAIISTFFSTVLHLPIYDRNFLVILDKSSDSMDAYSVYNCTLIELDGGANLCTTVLS
jgi:hypothetical protein